MFLYRTFVAPNVRALSAQDLTSRLDDQLFELRARAGDGAFPRSSAEYLDAWASDDSGWLRKYYPPDSQAGGTGHATWIHCVHAWRLCCCGGCAPRCSPSCLRARTASSRWT